ncbi:MAG: carbon storage regulator [Mariniblastus sp.]|nr:carbon storage regulator [Mariniblastus sp.]
MLVLSRKQNQSVVIDNQIQIEVLKIKGNTVRLGIKAPRNIKVLRGELSPFEVEVNIAELNAASLVSDEEEELQRLPNPFAVAYAS